MASYFLKWVQLDLMRKEQTATLKCL